MCLCHGLLLSIIDPVPARNQINKLGTKVLVNGVKNFINLVQNETECPCYKKMFKNI